MVWVSCSRERRGQALLRCVVGAAGGSGLVAAVGATFSTLFVLVAGARLGSAITRAAVARAALAEAIVAGVESMADLHLVLVLHLLFLQEQK